MEKETQESNAFGITGLTLALVGLLFLPFLFGILAVIFSAIGMAKEQKYAKAGLIIGIIDIVWSIVAIFLAAALFMSLF